ncbi:WxcM-like domain-containing protein [Paraburkholderia lycopersici]|uniref:dTDP-4-dehydrorhamnose 3,5-epimerase n=1 Tax=Paraburkholderia lycopersici TaxID=416944 RepID=A0A1G6T6Z2_9BURK|nr:WxcM-like domain-containing protein [Paraburkholderia lycopersici]SDD24644.1 dTDP-4-dehydrorhamnose 3,5-epimerase [Paraburkholderia lycopersici]
MDAMKEMLRLTPLRRIAHPKGDVLHALKASEPDWESFGEAYFTMINGGETKGWKRHRRMKMNLVVPVGMVRFHVHDAESARTRVFDLGRENYARLTVPPGYWMAFTGLTADINLVLNLASIEHDPEEAINAPLDAFSLE